MFSYRWKAVRGAERERARRRIANLRKIVRKALSDYHAIAVARQR